MLGTHYEIYTGCNLQNAGFCSACRGLLPTTPTLRSGFFGARTLVLEGVTLSLRLLVRATTAVSLIAAPSCFAEPSVIEGDNRFGDIERGSS